MYKQVYDPIAGSLGWSSLIAALPLVTLFVLLGALRWKAHWAALVALAVSLVVAIAVYGMPVGQALDAGLEGAAFGLFPIMWSVVNAIWIYNMTVESGHFAVLRRSFGAVSDDHPRDPATGSYTCLYMAVLPSRPVGVSHSDSRHKQRQTRPRRTDPAVPTLIAWPPDGRSASAGFPSAGARRSRSRP